MQRRRRAHLGATQDASNSASRRERRSYGGALLSRRQRRSCGDAFLSRRERLAYGRLEFSGIPDAGMRVSPTVKHARGCKSARHGRYRTATKCRPLRLAKGPGQPVWSGLPRHRGNDFTHARLRRSSCRTSCCSLFREPDIVGRCTDAGMGAHARSRALAFRTRRAAFASDTCEHAQGIQCAQCQPDPAASRSDLGTWLPRPRNSPRSRHHRDCAVYRRQPVACWSCATDRRIPFLRHDLVVEFAIYRAVNGAPTRVHSCRAVNDAPTGNTPVGAPIWARPMKHRSPHRAVNGAPTDGRWNPHDF